MIPNFENSPRLIYLCWIHWMINFILVCPLIYNIWSNRHQSDTVSNQIGSLKTKPCRWPASSTSKTLIRRPKHCSYWCKFLHNKLGQVDTGQVVARRHMWFFRQDLIHVNIWDCLQIKDNLLLYYMIEIGIHMDELEGEYEL